jgi:hypothetical protein
MDIERLKGDGMNLTKKVLAFFVIFIIFLSLIYQVKFIAVSTGSDGSAVLFVDPETLIVEPGQIFTVNVCVTNVNNLGKWSMGLSWDPKVIELDPVSSSAISEGSFLRNVGLTFYRVSTYNAGSGSLSYISSELMLPIGASGSGVLLSARFKAMSRGETIIKIVNSALYDNMKQALQHNVKYGQVSVESVLHDLLVNLDAQSSVIFGEQTDFRISVKNCGEVEERNVNVNILINSSIVQSLIIPNILSKEAYNFSYRWRPSDLGVYNLTVVVSPVIDESIIENNVKQLFIHVLPNIHDISVFLECPKHAYVDQSVLLNITVINLGGFEEKITNVTLNIISSIDQVKEAWAVPTLKPRDFYRISYLWQPKNEANYTVTVRVPALLGESDFNNNVYSVQVVVSRHTKASILVVSDDGGYYQYYGTSLKEFKLALDQGGYFYDVWVESVNGTIVDSSVLKPYDIVIWTCGDYAGWVIDPREAQAIADYVNNGGNILMEGEKFVFNLVKRGEYALLNNVLSVQYQAYSVETSGLAPFSTHLINEGLGEVYWMTVPTRYPDGVVPIGAAFSAMHYIGTNYSAVTVVDGSETGKGSVVYFSFSLFNLPMKSRNILVENCIRWFNRWGVSVVLGRILHAPCGSVSFVYGNFAHGSLEFDLMAGGMLYSLLEEEQKQLFADEVNMTELSTNIICLFGNPTSNGIVSLLNATGNLPIILYQNNSTYVIAVENRTVYQLSYTDLANRSAFVVQTCKIGNMTLLVVYGLDWRGMWAAGLYLSRVLCRNLRDYYEPYYVFEWADMNGDLKPQVDEIVKVVC